MSNWVDGFTAGVSATVIGFVFTMLWDSYKYRRDKNSRVVSVLKSIEYDLQENRLLLKHNFDLLNQEISGLRSEKEVLLSLTPFKPGFWDLIKFERPDEIILNLKVFSVMQDLYLVVNSVNEAIRTRQSYKTFNGAMTDYYSMLSKQDEIIIHMLNNMRDKLDQALAEIEKT